MYILLSSLNWETDVHDTGFMKESLSSLRAVKEPSFCYLEMHRPRNHLMLEKYILPSFIY